MLGVATRLTWLTPARRKKSRVKAHVVESKEHRRYTHRAGRKILFIEDDITVADLLQQCFEAEGYIAKKCTQSLRAIDEVLAFRPDLICLDLLMPYLEGEDILRILRLYPDLKEIPVIIVTACHECVARKSEYKTLGAIEMFTKPFDLDKLIRKIDLLLQ